MASSYKTFATQFGQEVIGVYKGEAEGENAARLAAIRPAVKHDQYPADPKSDEYGVVRFARTALRPMWKFDNVTSMRRYISGREISREFLQGFRGVGNVAYGCVEVAGSLTYLAIKFPLAFTYGIAKHGFVDAMKNYGHQIQMTAWQVTHGAANVVQGAIKIAFWPFAAVKTVVRLICSLGIKLLADDQNFFILPRSLDDSDAAYCNNAKFDRATSLDRAEYRAATLPFSRDPKGRHFQYNPLLFVDITKLDKGEMTREKGEELGLSERPELII